MKYLAVKMYAAQQHSYEAAVLERGFVEPHP
jgi:hypothetical protein